MKKLKEGEEVKFEVEVEGIDCIEVMAFVEEGRIRTYAKSLFQVWGILNEKTGKLITNGDDITTNYGEVASELVLKKLGYNVKVSQPFPCKRQFTVLAKK